MQIVKRGALAVLLGMMVALWGVTEAQATPSTTYWTVATTDVQPFNVWHIGVDNYVRLFQTQEEVANSQFNAFSTIAGLTVGVLPFEKLNLEVGIDGLFPGTQTHPALKSIGSSLLFNGKFGIPDGAFGDWSPAFNVGIFNVGTKGQVTNMNIVHAMVGKNLGPLGRLHAGYYYGNPGSVLMHQGGCIQGDPNFGCGTKTDAGKLDNDGFMVGYDYGFWKVKDAGGNEHNKWILAADYASGKNFIGGGGVGIYHFFNKDISLLTGPVWFNDHAINGQWKWTVQLDINF